MTFREFDMFLGDFAWGIVGCIMFVAGFIAVVPMDKGPTFFILCILGSIIALAGIASGFAQRSDRRWIIKHAMRNDNQSAGDHHIGI